VLRLCEAAKVLTRMGQARVPLVVPEGEVLEEQVDAAACRKDRWRWIAVVLYRDKSPGDALALELMQAWSPPGQTALRWWRLTLLLRAQVKGTSSTRVMPRSTKRTEQGRDA